MARPFALLRTRDQWSRAAHEWTAIDAETGGVELARRDDELPPGPTPGANPEPAGLAFDRGCRLFHSVPKAGRVERLLWGAIDPTGPIRDERQAMNFIVGEPPPAGDFEPVSAERPVPLVEPRGLAVDVDDHLFVAETGAQRILVYDLWSSRLIRRVGIAPGEPLDLARRYRTVWALLAGDRGIVRLGARTGPAPVRLRRTAELPLNAAPARIAVDHGGELFVLFVDGTGHGWIVPQGGGHAHEPIPHATDLEFLEPGLLVVAGAPGEELAQYRLDAGAVMKASSLKASGYDGGGIVRTPDGRIGFWTEQGFRTAVVARARYRVEGRVYTYRLDSGEYQTEWGRVFLDACIPKQSEVRAHFATADEVSDEPTIPRTPPLNLQEVPLHPELSPPTVPVAQKPELGDVGYPLFRRETGRELPWSRPPADDVFETYEAPIHAPPGRYLWVTLTLRGDGRVSPRVKTLRAEYPSHDLLRRLPRGFSRDERVADFLRRYLAMFDGTLGELEARGDARSTLLDPHAAPEELLPWLASFLGLALDESWPEPRRRQLIDEVPTLWRQRGTVRGLTRFLELYLGRKPLIIEHFKLRGLGGALLTDEPSSLFAGAIVGANLRVGGEVGAAGEAPLSGTATDAFTTHAHRFSVLIPVYLNADHTAAVQHILDSQRPAHTVVDICTVAAGMRVGLGLHVDVLSIIGPTGGWTPARVGGAALDRGAVLGRPDEGSHVGVDRLDTGLRVG